MKKIFPILMILFLTACTGAEKTSDNITVYTSFYAMNDFVHTVGGTDIVYHSIVPTGTEPHGFEPTAADMAKLSEADLFVYSGLGIDSWVEDVVTGLPDTVSVVCASEHVAVDSNDSHVWLSLSNAKQQLSTICDALSVVDERNFEKYRQRLKEYTEQIDVLEAEYANAGFEGKKLFVTHGAYGYLCAELGMEQIALEGTAGESDPSPAQMAEFVDMIKAEGAKYIYYDPLEGDKTALAAAKEAGVEVLPLCTFESDAEHRDYISVMRENLEQLKQML